MWDSMPCTTTRITHITIPSWYQVNMAMEYSLTCCFAIIYANVKALYAGICQFNLLLQVSNHPRASIDF